MNSDATSHPPDSLPHDGLNVIRGMLMGIADVVPGVSGGTVALVVGIYPRLVTAISHIDVTALQLLRRGQFRAAARHVDLRFLLALGAGVVTGIIALGSVINVLLGSEVTRAPTLAAFFGMILASAWLVARWVKFSGPRELVGYLALGILGAAFALWVTMLPATRGDLAGVDPTLPYLFLCGVIGICAMILPGISGAYLLLILGVYVYLTDILHALPRGEVTSRQLLAAAIFSMGCAVGLAIFSRVLRWMLANFRSPTMAVLCGFMLGAIGKIWPFQRDLTPEIEKISRKQFEYYLPSVVDTNVLAALAVGLAAMFLVLAFDWQARRMEKRQQAAGAKLSTKATGNAS